MPHPATIYTVVKTLNENELPITVDQVIQYGEIIDTQVTRTKVEEILSSLVCANLAGKMLGKFRVDGQESFIIDCHVHTGVFLNKPDNPLSAKILHERVCFQMQYLIEFNNTIDAYKLACEYLIVLGKNAQPILDRFKAVESLCEMEGHTPASLSQYKREVAAMLFKLAKSFMSEYSYKMFCRSHLGC